MPKSKNRPAHAEKKKKLNNLKTKNKQKMNEQEMTNQLPPVRTVPTWQPEAEIVVKGFEWEAIQNAFANINMATQASNSVMSRNILNGVIKLEFEKLVPGTMEYTQMTEEEKAPHREDFNKRIAEVKANIAQAEQAAAATQNGTQAVSETPDAAKPKAVKPSVNDVQSIGQAAPDPGTDPDQQPAEKPAKVVKMKGKK